MATPDPRPPGPGPDPQPPSPTPDPTAAAAGPEPAADLGGARRANPDGAVGLRGAQRDLRRAARRHRGERSRAGPDPQPTSCPRWPRRASRCPSSSSTRRSRAGCGARSSTRSDRKPKGRRLRYAVGELLTCTRCMGAWSALGLVALRAALARRRTHGGHGARRERRERSLAGELQGHLRPRERHRAGAPAPPRAVPRSPCGVTALGRVILRTARFRSPRRLGCTLPGVPERVTFQWAQQRTDATSLRRAGDGTLRPPT